MDPNGFDPAHGGSSLIHGEPVRMNGMLLPLRVDGTEAQITILNNTFENIMWGLQLWDNSGGLAIKNNSIMMNPVDEVGNPIGFVWAGIDIQNFGQSRRAPVQISDNFIYSKVLDFVFGMLLQSKNAIVKNNLLVLEQPQESLWTTNGYSAGIFIGNESFDNLIIDNTIQGSGQNAILLEGLTEYWTSENNIIKNNDVSNFIPLEATDFWCQIFIGVGCPTYPGAHYKLTSFTSNNTVIDEKWMEGIILLDETSDFNPYDPATYNGNNNIMLGSK